VSGVGLASIGHDVTASTSTNEGRQHQPGRAPDLRGGPRGCWADGRRPVASHDTDLRAAVQNSNLTMIAVGTPFDGKEIDLTYVEGRRSEIGEALAAKDELPRGGGEEHGRAWHHRHVRGADPRGGVGQGDRHDIGVGMNPEFLARGHALSMTSSTRTGSCSAVTTSGRSASAPSCTSPSTETEVVRTTPRTAEMIKYAANSLLATLISFSNEIANLSRPWGRRHGGHARRPPRPRFTPILDDGSACGPASVTYLEGGLRLRRQLLPEGRQGAHRLRHHHDSSMRLLRSVIDVNESQPQRMLDLLARHLPDSPGAQ
jgi:UDPglucose 6-dehydrogenase